MMNKVAKKHMSLYETSDNDLSEVIDYYKAISFSMSSGRKIGMIRGELFFDIDRNDVDIINEARKLGFAIMNLDRCRETQKYLESVYFGPKIWYVAILGEKGFFSLFRVGEGSKINAYLGGSEKQWARGGIFLFDIND